MPGGHDSRGSMHVQADVLRRQRQRFARMDAHPDTEFLILGPVGRSKGLLRRRRCPDRVLSTRKRDEERVPLEVDLIAAVLLERLT